VLAKEFEGDQKTCYGVMRDARRGKYSLSLEI
jgi:hypothetical protein